MCGIVGYIGPRQAPHVVLQGLKRLEYRGYDSAGIAALNGNGRIDIRRDVGKLSNLEALLSSSPLAGHSAIGHTRWATHGAPTQRNAHPHLSMNGSVVVVHNGIVENFKELREELAAEGVVFQSDTDTEVIVQLAERYMAGGLPLEEAARLTLIQLNGANAVVMMAVSQPDRLVCARGECGRPDAGHRRGRDVHRLRYPSHPGIHPPHDLSGEPRDGDHHPRRVRDP